MPSVAMASTKNVPRRLRWWLRLRRLQLHPILTVVRELDTGILKRIADKRFLVSSDRR
jgi:hypothetical protein